MSRAVLKTKSGQEYVFQGEGQYTEKEFNESVDSYYEVLNACEGFLKFDPLSDNGSAIIVALDSVESLEFFNE